MRPRSFELRWAQRACCFWLLLPSGCLTLGPTPTMTGVPPLPNGRSSLELQAAAVPGYYLSETVQQDPKATALPQLLGVFEPAQLIGVPGVLAGARYAGDADSGAALEPLLGYRTFLDDAHRFGLSGVGFVAYTAEQKDFESFTALRGGLESTFDANLTGFSKYAELHANVGATLTLLSVDGRYCLDERREYGVDCDGAAGAPPLEPPVAAGLSGVFPSGHAGLSLDFGRHLRSAFHGARLGLDVAGGAMPTVIGAEQRGMTAYLSGGLSLSIGIGASTAK